MFSKLIFLSVSYHGSWHKTETPETLGFSPNNRLGIREGPSQESNSKTSSINSEIWFSIFQSFILTEPIQFSWQSILGSYFSICQYSNIQGPLNFSKTSVFLWTQEQNPDPILCFSYHLYGHHHCRCFHFSIPRGFFSSDLTFINFDGIHNFSSPVETRVKPLPQHSTSPGFHCEFSTSLK